MNDLPGGERRQIAGDSATTMREVAWDVPHDHEGYTVHRQSFGWWEGLVWGLRYRVIAPDGTGAGCSGTRRGALRRVRRHNARPSKRGD